MKASFLLLLLLPERVFLLTISPLSMLASFNKVFAGVDLKSRQNHTCSPALYLFLASVSNQSGRPAPVGSLLLGRIALLKRAAHASERVSRLLGPFCGPKVRPVGRAQICRDANQLGRTMDKLSPNDWSQAIVGAVVGVVGVHKICTASPFLSLLASLSLPVRRGSIWPAAADNNNNNNKNNNN